jgi:glycerophosphoryl diester phosphodiesterase
MAENPWLERRVIAYAHQGGAREAPSSTLYAISRAIEAGATAMELDVHRSADGHLVVCHDATVDRTTNSSGDIATMTLAELQALDNAYWFVPGEDARSDLEASHYPLRGRAPDDHRYGIASLEEVLDATAGIVLNLDIKRTAPSVEPYEHALADLLRERERVDDVIVASFLDIATDELKAYAPEIATSPGTFAVADFYRAVRAGEPAPESVLRHVALQVPASFNDMTVLDHEFVTAAHRAGLAVHAWTINDGREMEHLLDLGIEGVITDVPSVLTGVLEGRGTAWRGLTDGRSH